MKVTDEAGSIPGYIIYEDEKIEKIEVTTTKTDLELVEEAKTEDKNDKFKGKQLKEFMPVMLKQFEEMDRLEYETFDQCVDEYFSAVDKYRESSKFQNKENEIWKKMNRIKDDQMKRISGL